VLVILAFGAGLASFLGIPALWYGSPPVLEHFLAPVFSVAEEVPKVYPSGTGHGVEWLLMLSSVAMATLGLAAAWWMYRGRGSPVPEALRARFPSIHRAILNKYKVDEFYQATVVRGFMATSRLSAWLDAHVVDGLVNFAGALTRFFAWLDGAIDKYLVDGLVNGLGALVRAAGAGARRLQHGRLPSYLAFATFGAIVLFVLTRFLMDMAG